VTHRDKFCPSSEGELPDIGSFIALIKEVTGREPDVSFGKPDVNLIKSLIKKYGVSHLALVGDRLYTDKALADNANLDFVCVLSGETTRFDVALLPDSEKYPAIVIPNLGDL
jgi:ribonucleotide monophosphatase NagD (HAD superfamily)